MDSVDFEIDRFYDASEHDYRRALSEVTAGAKLSHWMWYIFPQLTPLGYSPIAKHYSITCMEEAGAFFDDEVLGARLREITGTLLTLETDDAVEVFGELDAKKLRNSMTLFREAAPECDLFGRVLDKFFDGTPDQLTVKLLG